MSGKVKVVKGNIGLIPMEISGRSDIKVKSDCKVKESFIESKLNQEIDRSVRTDESLQEQIDRLMSSNFAVRDVVLTHEDLVNYPADHLIENDVIVVLYDTPAKDRSTYYRWDGSAFESIGSSSYTISEIDRLIADLNAQIERLGEKSSVRDVVASYADLESYSKAGLVAGDVIAVLDDETSAHASTYYRYLQSGQWEFHGSIGPNYYTKYEIDDKLEQINDVLENHEVRITDNRNDIDNRMSESEAYDILVG